MIKEKFKKIKKYFKENKLSALVTIFLGVTTFLVAWAGWIGSLHGGLQAINFTKSNNLASQGNAEYNVAAQVYVSDLFSWNTLLTLQTDLDIAKAKGDQSEVNTIKTKIEKIKSNSCSPRLLAAINQTDLEKGVSPFENEEFTSGYFEEAKKLLDESQAAMEEGKQDNTRGDSFQLASVFYSLVLFLLGLVGVIKEYQSRKLLFIISMVILAIAIIYMLTLPMPTGFDITSFFNHQ